MTRPGHFFWWRGHHADRSGDGRWTEVGEEAFQEDERRITGRHRLPGPVPDWAEDLFRVARAAFIVDKYVRRDGGRDRWARHVRLSVPVTEYGRWRSGTVRDDLAGLFQLLTGDAWEIEFRPLTGHGVEEALDFPEEPRASEVALFSGGLDSTSWAAARSRVEDSRPLLLVMFREIGLLRQQRQVYSAVERLSGARPVMLLPMSQTPRGTDLHSGWRPPPAPADFCTRPERCEPPPHMVWPPSMFRRMGSSLSILLSLPLVRRLVRPGRCTRARLPS